VIPFVGAGFSAGFDFPQWGSLLNQLASSLPGANKDKVAAAVEKEEYERAASIVAKQLGDFDFQAAISASFPDAKLTTVDVSAKAVAYVPLLASGLVITTNYDGVLEYVFERAGRRFERVVLGSNPNEIVPAIQQNRRTLWKLHGDRNDARTRVLAKGDYDRHYKDLPALLALAFANRPALFLGCALERDRTVDVLADMHTRWPGVRHFALLQYPKSAAKLDARVKRLRQLGVRPILYPKDDFTPIGPTLSTITQRASAFTVPIGHPPEVPNDGAKAGPRLLAKALREVEPHPKGPGKDAVPYTALLDPLLRGELVCFLGAAASGGNLPLADEFYKHLAGMTGEVGELDHIRLTQHFADLNTRGALDREVKRMLGDSKPAPSALHRLLATLPRRMDRPPLILTTNFDDGIERALLDAGEPHHLFTFRVESPHAGRFVHQRPDGAVSIVDRPERFHKLPDEHPIVVKYHGGLHQRIDLPVAYAYARCDFMETTRALPAALPRVLRDRLRASRLLFLGQGLWDESVESLAREIRGPARSWALQLNPVPGWREYWAAIGVDILDVDLARFVRELHAKLAKL
jgi:hypothetical protein